MLFLFCLSVVNNLISVNDGYVMQFFFIWCTFPTTPMLEKSSQKVTALLIYIWFALDDKTRYAFKYERGVLPVI